MLELDEKKINSHMRTYKKIYNINVSVRVLADKNKDAYRSIWREEKQGNTNECLF